MVVLQIKHSVRVQVAPGIAHSEYGEGLCAPQACHSKSQRQPASIAKLHYTLPMHQADAYSKLMLRSAPTTLLRKLCPAAFWLWHQQHA
jgi:hypothetical protein